jgi:hypothetical protein
LKDFRYMSLKYSYNTIRNPLKKSNNVIGYSL